MNTGKLPLLQGPSETNADNYRPPVLIAETYHSTIRLGQFNGRVAIIKACRNQNDSRTMPRFRNEVDALRLAGSHVSRILLRKTPNAHFEEY